MICSSGSIGSSEFELVRTQLARLMGLLCHVPDPFKGTHQAGLLRFASYVTEMFSFEDHPDTLGVQSGIRDMSYTGGATGTATAFNVAKTTMSTT